MKSFVSFTLLLLVQGTHAAIHRCTTVQDIKTAMRDVVAGDEIVIAPGEYLSTNQQDNNAHFTSAVDGTEGRPIVMRSEDPNNQAVLSGDTVRSRYVVRIFGAYWRIQDLTMINAQKGIIFDNASHGKVINCNVRIFIKIHEWVVSAG